MKKLIRFSLPLLIVFGMAGAFYLEERSQLSTSEHMFIQILIVGATCWLTLRWFTYEEMRSLREYRNSKPMGFHYRFTSLMEDADTQQNEPTGRRLNETTNAFHSEPMIDPINNATKRTMVIHISPRHIAYALMSVGIVFALTVVMLYIGSKTLGEGVITVLYLIPIGWCTARWGQLAGVSAALTAALSFDFLFIPPYRTFNIGRLEGWLLLLLFIATAILVVGRIQSILTAERERERKATFLYEVVAAISSQATREGIARAIANQIQEKFLAEDVRVHLPGGWGYPSFVTFGDKRRASASHRKPDRVLSIVYGLEKLGEIDIWKGTIALPNLDDPMLQTMLNQIVAALNRVRLGEGKSPYPQQKPSSVEGNLPYASHS